MSAVIATFLTTLYGFYNTIFQPILALGPYIALGVFSAALALIFSLIYWYLLDIEKQDELKEKINKHQDKMKEARKENNSDKASDHMQRTMEFNQKMMMLNFKPMIATMVFVALIFPWLGSTFGPAIHMNQVSNTTYTGNFTYAGQSKPIEVVNDTNMTVRFDGNTTHVKNGEINAYGVNWDITGFGTTSPGMFSTYSGKVLHMNARFVDLPFSIPLAGEALNWLGYYILIAMPLTFIFRKLLGVA
ncbi:MAG: EMC3/TMCO1 family protein [Candidatus Nanohaloarchaea archaeon]